MNKEKALSLAAAICSKKEHCSWEIQEKLVKWEIPEKEIDRIMTFLHQHRFIDDARYAQAYAEDKFRFNHWGKQKIALMLPSSHPISCMVHLRSLHHSLYYK